MFLLMLLLQRWQCIENDLVWSSHASGSDQAENNGRTVVATAPQGLTKGKQCHTKRNGSECQRNTNGLQGRCHNVFELRLDSFAFLPHLQDSRKDCGTFLGSRLRSSLGTISQDGLDCR